MEAFGLILFDQVAFCQAPFKNFLRLKIDINQIFSKDNCK